MEADEVSKTAYKWEKVEDHLHAENKRKFHE